MPAHRQALITGTLYALAAGLMWGLVFVAPTMLSEYPAALLSVSRYLAFGVIALLLAAGLIAATMEATAGPRGNARKWAKTKPPSR